MMNYKRISLLLLWLTLAVNGFPLYDGIELGWSYPTNETVSFNLSVPVSLIEQNAISFLFLAIRPTNQATNSSYMDVVLVNFTNDSIEDEFPNERGFPQLDKELNGTDDLFDKSAEIAGENKYFTWSRNFFSNDTKDISLIPGQLYALLWVYGNISANWTFTITKSGSQPITFHNSRILYGEDKGPMGDHHGGNQGDQGDHGDHRGDGDKNNNDTDQANGSGFQDNDDYDFDDDGYQGNSDDDSDNDYDYDESGNKTLRVNPLLSGSIERFLMPIWILSIFLV
ncbi:unnamed protein product [Blepharisma stoltei]|uniref:Uncharacterized protein n=1 Tax=Blepharisma stoltei TaxID=1481888 RepID=A0AAU9K2T1_9CILI|nr:unnamed protein product [Blepharisma stoltei]